MKHKLYCLISIVAGIGISILACYIDFYPEMINFIGGMCIMGGFLFLDAMMMKKVSNEKGSYPKKYLFRLAIYFVLSVLLLLLPLQISVPVIFMRIAKALGEAGIILVLWNFFSYTTIEREV